MKVLVVDDYKPWQDSICSTVGTVQGLHVVSRAADGLEAVQKAEEIQPDLILLDIGLPGMNGIEAALQIRQLVPKTRILFVSENRNAEIINAAIASGAVGYIVKSNAAKELPPALQTIRCCIAQNTGNLPGAGQKLFYEEIVDFALSLMRSDYASMQMLFPERGTEGKLRLLAFRGFDPQAARVWEWVRADSKCVCGIALRNLRRVVAPDIATFDLLPDSEAQRVYLQTGIRACQTTPLISRSGDLVGMISTHWRTPHQPSDDDFRLFDILARSAADVIEHCKPNEP
jgi:DNA-binding NarL/FixJ family response regulator